MSEFFSWNLGEKNFKKKNNTFFKGSDYIFRGTNYTLIPRCPRECKCFCAVVDESKIKLQTAKVTLYSLPIKLFFFLGEFFFLFRFAAIQKLR